jgi:hypothetical protein
MTPDPKIEKRRIKLPEEELQGLGIPMEIVPDGDLAKAKFLYELAQGKGKGLCGRLLFQMGTLALICTLCTLFLPFVAEAILAVLGMFLLGLLLLLRATREELERMTAEDNYEDWIDKLATDAEDRQSFY